MWFIMFDLTNDVIEELRASKRWTDRFHDRGSEIVFIGTKLDKKHMFKELHNALLMDAELNVLEDTRKKVCASDMIDHFFDCMPLWELEDILGEEDREDTTWKRVRSNYEVEDNDSYFDLLKLGLHVTNRQMSLPYY